mmetsp:Transcript_17391/g.38302  ORF Transcript_17391/g.38302 Transcript_17391/m.38302 type:complete len:654 (+) Transcript_17391:48-2009(+)
MQGIRPPNADVCDDPRSRLRPTNFAVLQAMSTPAALKLVSEAEERVKTRKAALNVDLHESISQARRRVRELATTWFVVDPRRSPWIEQWDLLLVVVLAYTALVTPLEVAFLSPGFDAIFVCNRVCDLVFVMDICISFVRGFPRMLQAGRTLWVVDFRTISMTYLKSWCVLDILTIVPFEFILRGVDALDDSRPAPAGSRNLKLARVLRVLRLIKIARVVGASKLYQRYFLKIQVSFATLQLIQFAILILLTGHWMGCIWGLAIRVQEGGLNWFDALMAKNPQFRSDMANPMGRYLLSLYFSVATLTTVGYGDIAPTTRAEFVIAFWLQFYGSCTFAYIIGTACGLFTSLDESGIRYRKTFDMVNNFIYDQGVMPELAVRLREYFNQSYRMDHVSGYEKILNKMTKALRAEVALEMHGEAMGGVWYLQEDRMQMSPDDHQRFIEALCVKLCLRMYAPKEYMDHPGHLKVLKRGVATVGGRVKRAIAVWGLEMIVPAAIRTDSVAFSLTFCELYTLSNEELFECAQTHLHRALQETPHSVGVSRLRVMQLWMVLITSSKKVGREKIRQRERAGELAASSSNVLTSSNVASLWGHIFSTENGDLGASRVGSPAVGKPPPLVQKSLKSKLRRCPGSGDLGCLPCNLSVSSWSKRCPD